MNQLDFSDTMFVPKEYYRSLMKREKFVKETYFILWSVHLEFLF